MQFVFNDFERIFTSCPATGNKIVATAELLANSVITVANAAKIATTAANGRLLSLANCNPISFVKPDL